MTPAAVYVFYFFLFPIQFLDLKDSNLIFSLFSPGWIERYFDRCVYLSFFFHFFAGDSTIIRSIKTYGLFFIVSFFTRATPHKTWATFPNILRIVSPYKLLLDERPVQR